MCGPCQHGVVRGTGGPCDSNGLLAHDRNAGHGTGQAMVVQDFAESLQQHSSNQSKIVMIKLYCCGLGYCSRYHYSTTSSK